MNIIQVSILTPFKENVRGTSALPYHLMVKRDKDIKIEIYSFNCNHLSDEQIAQVEKEQDVKIHIIPLPKWFVWIFKLHLLFLRVFLKYPLHNYITLPRKMKNEIVAKQPDGVWIYGEELSRVSRQLAEFRRVHTFPDSEALFYYRMLGQRFVMNDKMKYWRCAFMYRKFRLMERNMDDSPNVAYHLVGDEDAKFLKDMNPRLQAYFIRHPHYEVKSCEKEQITFSKPKIKLLVAGQYNYYMKQDADEMVEALVTTPNLKQLIDKYKITFLGRGWEHHVEKLQKVGWEAQHITFAQDYIEEISKYDIQLTPISIGTGTKGKVLDALANGLLVIGSYYAMENIAVADRKECLIYQVPKEIPQFLLQITEEFAEYEDMAARAENAVRKKHNRENISQRLFSLFEDSIL